MKILFVAEIVGRAGHSAVKLLLKKTITEQNIDFVIANVNGATGGFGIGKVHAITLKKRGVDVLTGGENIFLKKDFIDFLPKNRWALRPANLPPGIPGNGWGVYKTKTGGEIGVINMVGQSGYSRMHGNNPFTYLPDIAEKIRKRTKIIIFNFHAATTAEKQSMIFHADSLVSAVIGSGARCQSADAGITEKGTAFITDSGRTGSRLSVYGLESSIEMKNLLTGMPVWSKDGWGDNRLQGVILDAEPDGSVSSIKTLDIPSEEATDDPHGSGN